MNMSIFTDLVEDNPWWRDPSLIGRDMKIVDLDGSVVNWKPRIAQTFNFSKDLVYSLRGPRQVGKTTLVKIQIKQKLDEGISPHNIMYYAFDVDTSPRDLVNVIKTYLDNTERLRKGRRCYIFLDEVSAVKDWQRGIKRLWDQGRLENCTVVATGSNTIDIKMSSERLPGRRGSSNDTLDKIMLPMKFSEFVAAIGGDIKDLLERYDLTVSGMRHMHFKSILDLNLDLGIEYLRPHIPKLNRYLMYYLQTGGTPRVINEYLSSGLVKENTFKTYLDAILGDLQSLNKNQNTFRRLIRSIIKAVGNTSSWKSLQKNTDIGSSDTVASYVDTLQNMFILSVFYQYSTESKRGLFQKNKKIHFHDPFYFHVLNGWVGGDRPSFDIATSYLDDDTNQGTLVEGVVANHLIRLAFSISSKKQNFEYSDILYYWRYGKDKEVDFVYNDGDGTEVPIEVKFQNRITSRDLDGLINFKRNTGQRNAILLSKDKLSLENEYVAIPVSLFLLLV
ncbi:MAG: ATP-binding protein [Cenarchaeum sp. SB0677_bin_16]|nr:ATP-binding protein [Cenarchaeum sp. SB0677_bin_16]